MARRTCQPAAESSAQQARERELSELIVSLQGARPRVSATYMRGTQYLLVSLQRQGAQLARGWRVVGRSSELLCLGLISKAMLFSL